MADVREKRVELILQELEDLPTLPAIAVRVLEVTGSADSDARQVVKLIQSDPALTTRILKLVHRADLSVRGTVTTVERAVSVLGFEAIRSAVLAVSVFQAFGDRASGLGAGHFVREEFWKHSVAVACCAELLAQMLVDQGRASKEVEPSEAFVCGLLHDLGKVALDAVLPKSFDRVVEAADLLRGNIADLERTIIGLDHMVVGKRLAERWQLPVSIRDAIWLHGQLPAALPATVGNPRLVNLVTLADLLAREQHLGYSGNYILGQSKGALIEAVGLDGAQVQQVLERLVEQIEPRACALGLGESSTRELYLSALSQANRELGRVSSQLAVKNRKLAVRARFFDVLNDFQSVLRPDAPPQVVLRAIGQTALSVLDVPGVCVFSLGPGQSFAEALVMDRAHPEGEALLLDVAGDEQIAALSGVASSGDGPVLNAGSELEWMLSEVSPRLNGTGRYWIRLETDGRCIGGVVWGAASGEAQRLGSQAQELVAVAGGWSLALRTAQIRDEARALAEQLAEANRRLHSAQNEILRGRTLVTIGEVAAGAAHEMNNPLAIISGRSQLLAAQLSDPKLSASAKLIHEQSHRLSEMITELMAFARPQPARPTPTPVKEMIDQVIQVAQVREKLADRTIERLLGEVPSVSVDREQLTEALVEVLVNAMAATDAVRGRVKIEAAFDRYSNRVVLSITDNGHGMDDYVLKHAFDPFYSARRAGRRRGMGLAKALRWIESSGGSIRLESRPEQGTRAIVLLPATEDRAEALGQDASHGQAQARLGG